MQISYIQTEDLDDIYQIEQAAHAVPWRFATFKNCLSDNYLNLKLSTADQQIIAFCICQCVLDEATLFNIAVSPTYQGKGYAKQLLNYLIDQLKQRHIQTIWLEVRQSNHIAQQLYTSLGFNQVTIRKNYYPLPEGGKEDAIIMALYLD